MKNDIIALAARNNALWCDAVCQVNGKPGEFYPALWLNRHSTPRFYPNAVTLARKEEPSELILELTTLIRGQRGCGWAVKDSFNELDLSSLGFESLFEARWISFDTPVNENGADNLIVVGNEIELLAWENAWFGPSDENHSELQLFRAGLLSDSRIVFASVQRDGAIIGGGILNLGAGVVGLSNVFGPSDGIDRIWQGLTALAEKRFPGLPLVGYEKGADLEAACRNGFRTIGNLRVWLRSA